MAGSALDENIKILETNCADELKQVGDSLDSKDLSKASESALDLTTCGLNNGVRDGRYRITSSSGATVSIDIKPSELSALEMACPDEVKKIRQSLENNTENIFELGKDLAACGLNEGVPSKTYEIKSRNGTAVEIEIPEDGPDTLDV